MEKNQGKKDSEYRDLTGPEKNPSFENINIPSLFPMLSKKNELKTRSLHLWKT